jgi:hypothetical protein
MRPNEKSMGKKDYYYQTIARFFLKHRGSPFFLSPREIQIISHWELQRVPLRIVLEGISNYFTGDQGKRKPGRRGVSLLLCDASVKRAYELYKNRRTGIHSKGAGSEVKIRQVLSAVRAFLKDLPEEMSCLESLYRAALEIYSRGNPDEEKIERLENKVEEMLLARASEQDRQAAQEEADREYPDAKEEERFSLASRLLVKSLTDKFKIPPLSLYYY